MSYKFCEGCKWNIVDTVQICTNPKIQRSECPVITDYKVDLQGRLKFNAEEYTCKYYEPHLESNPESKRKGQVMKTTMICNSAMKKRIAELERHNWDLREGKARVEQMMRRALDNNYELRNDNYQLRPRVEELERQLQGYKEENVKLLQTLLSLYRAVKKANCELDKIEESCDNNVWFCKLKERMY